MIGEPEVVVGTEVQERATTVDLDMNALRGRQTQLGLVRPGGTGRLELGHEITLKSAVHSYPATARTRLGLSTRIVSMSAWVKPRSRIFGITLRKM